MSAYVVSNDTISVIVKGFEIYGVGFDAEGYEPPETDWFVALNKERKSIGQYLLDRNYDSVNYRYGENTKPREFEYIEPKDINPGKIVGCINCYNYQTCEKDIDGEDYFRSELYAVLNRLKLAMLDWYIRRDEREIPWRIDY